MAGMTAPRIDEALFTEPDGDDVRVLTLNRPDRANALSPTLVQHVHARLDTVGRETRVLVVTGAGKHFCAGFDFTDYEQQSEGDLLLRFVRINELLARLRSAPFARAARAHRPLPPCVRRMKGASQGARMKRAAIGMSSTWRPKSATCRRWRSVC